MTWKKFSVLERRLKLVKSALRAQKGMTQLCRQFGFSRKTGYKWLNRFVQQGRQGLRDRSKRPQGCRRQTSKFWLKEIRRLHRRYRSWGSRKLAAYLRRQFPRRRTPAARTVAAWLKRLNLQRRRVRRTRRGPPLKRAPLTLARRSNHVWTVDFKGWFRTVDGQRWEPLTVRDLWSRFLLAVQLLSDQRWGPVQRVFMRLFAVYGYPAVIRVDNGSPFGTTGPAGLSRLSAWWTALGIRVEFIAPGQPQQNGGHEQMHRVLKAETLRPVSAHRRAQQRRLQRWRQRYNRLRPHQSLGQRPPAWLYRANLTTERTVRLKYPKRWPVRRVRSNGQIKWRGRKRFVGEAFVGYSVALQGLGAERWAVYFTDLLIGELWENDHGGMRPAKYFRRP
jgi:transposase InsO family protein